MKIIIVILLLNLVTYAQNTTYKDGTNCGCDSIHHLFYVNDNGDTEEWEVPFSNGKENGVEYWYLNSELHRTVLYHNGLRHGNTTLYDNDTITMVTTYANGFKTKSVSGYSTTTYAYNKKGQLIKEEKKVHSSYSFFTSAIYTYTKTTRTLNHFIDGNLSVTYVHNYKMRDIKNESIKSDNVEVGEALSETHYTKYGTVRSTAIIVDGEILYYACSSGKKVTYPHRCE